jgi:hypothetical protein
MIFDQTTMFNLKRLKSHNGEIVSDGFQVGDISEIYFHGQYTIYAK